MTSMHVFSQHRILTSAYFSENKMTILLIFLSLPVKSTLFWAESCTESWGSLDGDVHFVQKVFQKVLLLICQVKVGLYRWERDKCEQCLKKPLMGQFAQITKKKSHILLMISSHGKSSGFVCLRFSDKCVLVVFNPIQREQIKFQLTLKVLLWKIFHGCAVSERHRAFTAWIELGLPLLWKFDMQEFYNLVIWNWDYCQIIIAWYNLVWVRKYCLVRSRFSGPLMRRDFTLE